MGGVVSSVFGGGGGEQTSTSKTELDPALQAQSKRALTGAGSLFGQGTEGIFQDSRLTPLDPLVTQGQEFQLGLLPQFQQQTQDLQQSFAPLLSTDPNDPLLQARIQDFSDIVGEQFQRSVLPGISGGATSVGQTGSSRQGIAEGLAAGEAATAISRGVNELLSGQQQTALQASQLAPTIFGQQFAPGDVQAQIGRDRTLRSQAELEDFIQQFEAPRRAELQNLTEFTNLLRSNPLTAATTVTGTQTQPSGSPLQGLLGTGLVIGGLGTSDGGTIASSLLGL